MKENTMSFSKKELRPELISRLDEEGIEELTDIQKQAIPLIKEGKDVIAISKTGSGKTLAFALPILEMTQPKKGLQTIVLAPTRELAVQISVEFEKFGRQLGLKVATVYGGVGMMPQINAIRKCEIMVGTPGRILDHIGRGTLNLSGIKYFIIDEADKMADMGFIRDITLIFEKTPKQKQVLLFGATIGREVNQLKNAQMTNPVTVQSDLQVAGELLKQSYYNVQHNEKFSLLVHLLNNKDMGNTLIFCSTRHTVESLAKNLRKQGFEVEMIHGKLSQNIRMKAIEKFNKGNPRILVASSVAARGLHIEEVTHVINYDLSRDPEEYIHRIGRTARAGEKGEAITFLSEKDYSTFDQIHRRYDLKIKVLDKEEFKRIPFESSSSGRFGQRRQGAGRQHRSPYHSRKSKGKRPFRRSGSPSGSRHGVAGRNNR